MLLSVRRLNRQGVVVILFFMELSTRKVGIAGIGSSPSGLWMNQVGRHVTDGVDGLLNGKRYLIHDRDPLFTGRVPEPAG